MITPPIRNEKADTAASECLFARTDLRLPEAICIYLLICNAPVGKPGKADNELLSKRDKCILYLIYSFLEKPK